MTELSPVAVDTCERHYKGGRGCGKCPIQRQCHAPHSWGQEGIDSWRDKVNQAAVAGLAGRKA
ncbi:hypothetical protein [Billgrantia desiderata]|uniref:hypothetical protein n=1 Tax=Billgrantia desiderata TaxID=52021 RepID=UPI001F31C736|nr:hypothetical protein [Halomonas desiderata]